MTEKARDLSWRVSSSRALSCSRYWHRETAAIVFARFFYWKWRRMGLMEGREPSRGGGKIPAFCASAMGFMGLTLIAGPLPAFALELSAPQEALYTTVSIFPPSANSMTVCYGFVCRRREILDFTQGGRKGGGAEGRDLVRPPDGAGDRDRQARRESGFPLLRRQAQLRLLGHHPQHHQPAAGAAAMGSIEISCGGRPALSRQRAGAADAAQHGGAGRSRDQGRVGRGHVAE